MVRIPSLRVALTVLMVFASLLFLQAAEAKCVTCSPAAPVPEDRYEPDGKLAPAQILGDTTWYKADYEPGCNEPNWFDIDVEAGWLFAATGNGVELWNVSNPEALAERTGTLRANKSMCRPVLGTFKKSDTDFYHKLIDAPPGKTDVVAVGVGAGMGLVVINTADKQNPRVAYQDEGETSIGSLTTGRTFSPHDLYAANINGRSYAFVATDILERLAVYDLTRAKDLGGCIESARCASGVYLGPLGEHRSFVVDGVENYIVIQDGGEGIKVLDVSTPSKPFEVASAALKTGFGKDVAMWRSGNQLQVAAATGNKVELFNFNCSLSSCSLKAWKTLNTPYASLLTDSSDNGVPYLFVGFTAGEGRRGGKQLEFVYDMSGSAPEDITPQQHPDGYWGWYYEGNDTGFRRLASYAAHMHNGYLYRAGLSILDMHKRRGTSAPPLSNFSWSPTTIYPGTAVTFDDESSGKPNAWSWLFEMANITESSEENPAGVTFLEPGQWDVDLTASNEFGVGQPASQTLTVLDPNPNVASIQGTPNPAPVCSTVVFGSNGATGQPPLAWDWKVQNAAQEIVASGATASSWSWEVPAELPTGTYTAFLTLSNPQHTSATSTQQTTVAISPLDQLSLNGNPVLVEETLGAASFTVSAVGATSWTWDFGDGNCPAGFTKSAGVCTTTDPVLGQAPTHQYLVGDTDYQVTVTVDNCRDQAVTSEPVTVSVGPVVELKAGFTAKGVCFGGLLGCSANLNQTITFSDDSSGFPEVYEADWEGNGQFVAVTPSNGSFTHAYTKPGTFEPTLRVTRGSQTDTYTHQAITVTNVNQPPASVSVSRSTSTPLVDAAVTFTAKHNNCTAPTSWNWSIGSGGTISGSSSGSSISVTYGSAGNRTITAQAVGGGCDGKSGTTSVNVRSKTTGGGGGGGNGGGGGGGGGGNGTGNITAAFTFDPASSIGIGAEVTFNASSSKNATDYLWDFGDGTKGTGVSVTHTYAAAGQYEVKLEASRSDSTCSFGLCIGTVKKTLTVGNQVAPPPTSSNGCSGDDAENDKLLCLQNGRFEISVTFDHPQNGPGVAGGIWNSTKTGFFWFNNPNNVELIVKVLDGGPVNGNFWVFYGALTDIPYQIRVEERDSGVVKTFSSVKGQVGELCSGRLLDAFTPAELSGGGNNNQAPGTVQAPGVLGFDDEEDGEDGGDGGDGGDNQGGDTGNEPEETDALYLLDGRFKISVYYKLVLPEGTREGQATAVPGTDQSGYFWFFNSENLEMVVKMVDARNGFGKFWVFYGDLTSAAYTVTVEDLVTGEVKTYDRAQDGQCGRSDTNAFSEAL